MFIELHMIQNFAPANLNRDDTNSPKDCEFGGARRARISSQCIKRAIRMHPLFKSMTGVELADRAWESRFVRPIVKDLTELGRDKAEAEEATEAFLKQYLRLNAKKSKRQKDLQDVMVFIGKRERSQIAEAINDHWDACANQKDSQIRSAAKALAGKHSLLSESPDIAMFGRMLANAVSMNVNAACQVAHAISTHRVNMEMDFYTAVDDLATEEETGAGMMGVTGYNSSCFYRYSRIDWKQLTNNLNGDLDLSRRTVEGFLRAAVAAVPSGKQNAFAAHNPPAFLLAVVRNDGMGWSLANAFERPVRPDRDSGLMDPSIRALDAYWGRLCRIYGDDTLEAVAALSLETDMLLENLRAAQQANLDQWIATVLDTLPGEEEVI